jgi:hypothetical protein
MTRRAALAGFAAAIAGGGFRSSALAAMSVTLLKADDGREIPLSIWPAVATARGVILFSHGAMSAPWKYERLITPWTEAGFEIMAPLHVDSKDHPDRGRYPAAATWTTRLLDMRAVSAFADAPSYVAAGHSYGGLVALTLGGAAGVVPPGVTPPLRDPRARCVVAFSPPGATPVMMTREGYAALAVPALIQTGDRDVPLAAHDGRWQVHYEAYEAAPPGNKYGLVLAGVDHYFGGLICDFDQPGPAQTAQLASAAAISSLFLEAFGAGDSDAKRQLDDALSDSGPIRLSRKSSN